MNRCFLALVLLFLLTVLQSCKSLSLSLSIQKAVNLHGNRAIWSQDKLFALTGGASELDGSADLGELSEEVALGNNAASVFEEKEDLQEENLLAGLNWRSNRFVNEFVENWKKTPPITQAYIASSLIFTLASYVFNHNRWPSFLLLNWRETILNLQLWRPITAFCYFGPLGLNYLFTIHFVWTYMGQLERMNCQKPEEFAVMISFGMVALTLLYLFTGMSTRMLGHNLSTYLVYIWARIFEGTLVNMMDLFQLPAESLPWFFCLQSLILEGEMPFADLLGIGVGNMYHYLKKKKLLRPPDAFRKYFSTPQMKELYGTFQRDVE